MDKIVRLIKLPASIRGLTVTDPDGNYNIYINRNLSHEMQVITYLHESAHIDNGDFESYAPVNFLEERIKYSIKGK
ncbi:MAG: hypothetical protein ACOX4H_02330 [Bacillota bacterium]|jgi:hypothetical protein